MGIVKKQQKEIEELKKKAAGLERKAEYLKKTANDRALRATKAEAQMAAAELLIKILLHRLGGQVVIEKEEWKKDYGIVGARVDEEKKEFRLL